MKVAVTGGTGFLGRYILRRLLEDQHGVKAWRRPGSDLYGFSAISPHVEWVQGGLGDARSAVELVKGCDALVHAALYRPGAGFRGTEGDVVEFAQKNIIGTLQLIDAARHADVSRVVIISSCAVHEVILADRPLDEDHPTTPASHYGAHKAAIEQFVHSYGFGYGYPICALRPTGIYGVAAHPEDSKWYNLVRDILQGRQVTAQGGGKEVHASDVAAAVSVLLEAPGVAGQVYNCCDMYISNYRVAQLAKEITGSGAHINGKPSKPKHQISTGKLRSLGMEFGGEKLLRDTLAHLASAAASTLGEAEQSAGVF